MTARPSSPANLRGLMISCCEPRFSRSKMRGRGAPIGEIDGRT